MVALFNVMEASSRSSASNVTVPPAKLFVPSAVTKLPSPKVMRLASSVISPDAPVDAPVRWSLALEGLATWRDEMVMLLPIVILSSACSVRLPADHVSPASESLSPPSVDVLRRILAEIAIASGSISTSPIAPFWADAESEPPASSTTWRAENSTKPPSPLVPPSAERRAPACRVERPSAMTYTSPPDELSPRPDAEISAPRPAMILSLAVIET